MKRRQEVERFRMAVVVPTLGERRTLTRLFDSIQNQTLLPTEIIVVNQGSPELVRAAVAASTLNIRVVECIPGVSRARNVGIASLRDGWNAVALPDDDVWYEPHAFERASDALSRGTDALSGILLWPTSDRSRMRFPNAPLQLTPKTVWTGALEATLFLSKPYVDEIGTFCTDLGLGADGPWQSGEGTDLLLRGIKARKTIRFAPNIVLWEEDPSPAKTDDLVRRKRKYARGTGQVFARHYGVYAQLRLLVRSVGRLVIAAASLSTRRIRADSAVLIGRVEGLLSRSLKDL
jgi:glycosyltransferase involved in cell wall biosynthesis